MVAFPPGFVLSDGPTYLGLVDDLYPRTDRTVGYGFLLDGAAAVSRDVWLVTAVQHLLGLLTAVLLYVLLRRWSVPGGLATLACLPVLFDAMQLVLEHSPLSDVLFDLLVVAGDRRTGVAPASQGVATAALGGLLLGLAVCVRVVGQPLVVVAVLFCLWAATTWRARVLTSVVVALSFAVPVAAYAAWYHAEHGVWALTESGRPRAVHAHHRLRGLLGVHDAGLRASRCARRSRSARAWTPPTTAGTPLTPPMVSCCRPASPTTRRWATSRGGRSVHNPARTPGIVGSRPDARASRPRGPTTTSTTPPTSGGSTPTSSLEHDRP